MTFIIRATRFFVAVDFSRKFPSEQRTRPFFYDQTGWRSSQRRSSIHLCILLKRRRGSGAERGGGRGSLGRTRGGGRGLGGKTIQHKLRKRNWVNVGSWLYGFFSQTLFRGGRTGSSPLFLLLLCLLWGEKEATKLYFAPRLISCYLNKPSFWHILLL